MGKLMPFEEVRGAKWQEYNLVDGNLLRIKFELLKVMATGDKKPNGEPLYNIELHPTIVVFTEGQGHYQVPPMPREIPPHGGGRLVTPVLSTLVSVAIIIMAYLAARHLLPRSSYRYVGHRQAPGWQGSPAFYEVRCKTHG